MSDGIKNEKRTGSVKFPVLFKIIIAYEVNFLNFY